MTVELLPHLSLIEINGADAESFLQGQLSNDVSLLHDCWQFSAYCNPKGRTLALLQLWRSADGFYALLDQSLVEQTLKRLKMYVMRSKVELQHVDQACIYGLKSTDLNEYFPALGAERSESKQGVTIKQEQILLDMGERLIAIALTGEAPPVSGLLQQAPVGQDWLAEDIAAGLPRVNSNSYELFIPQMLNLDLLDGVNFKKGCYTGQEIVARMHYLGKLKQRMFICQLDGLAGSIEIGQKIYLEADHSKSVGSVVSSVDGFNLILAVIRLESAKQKLYLDSGQTLRVAEAQAYSIPES